jgi:hypothetical protein
MIVRKNILIFCSLLLAFIGQSQVTTTFAPTDDGFILSSAPNNEYNTSSVMYYYYISSGAAYRMHLAFNLSSIPTNAIVTSAQLKLYCYSVNNSNQHPAYLQRFTSPWVCMIGQPCKTWNNQPSVSTSDQKSITHTQTSSTGWHSFDVASHVQYMVNNPSWNRGWLLRMQNESGGTRGVLYRSKEYSGTTYDPYLEVTYILPIDISGTVSHCSQSASDGEITVSVSGGSTYSSYQWLRFDNGLTTVIESGSNIANADVDNLSAGLYMLTVVDNTGHMNYRYFLVGEEGATTTVSMFAQNSTTASKYWKDATVRNETGYGDINYGSYGYILGQYSPFVPHEFKTFVDFQTHYDQALEITEAELELTHPSWHYRGTPYDNTIAIKRVTQPWQEMVVNWYNRPVVNSTIYEEIPLTAAGYGYTDATLDLLSLVQYWQNNPADDYGLEYALKDPTASTGQWMRQIYGSSDISSLSQRPVFNLTYKLPAPAYVTPKRELTGGYFKIPYDDHLRFEFYEEYDKVGQLNYEVYNYQGKNIVSTYGLSPLSEFYGDNRYKLDVSALPPGNYVMHIINDKSEKWYLRFKKD